MGKRLFLVAVLATSFACKSNGTSGDSRMTRSGGATVAATDSGRDVIEVGLSSLLEGRVIRHDLNQARDGRIVIQQAHLLNEMILLETGGDRPLLFGLNRNGLDPRWVSPLREATKYQASENDEIVVLLSGHYAHVLEKVSGRRALQFVRGELAGLRQPFLELPVSPTAGAAVGIDTFYIPSLGGAGNNKTIESVSAINGAFGWGYRTSGDILTTPVVAGSRGDPKLYFVTSTGLVTCIDAANYGTKPAGPRWEQLLERRCDFDIFVTSDTRDRAGAVYAVDRSGIVYALNRITGDRNWTYATERIPTGAPMVFGGELLVVKNKTGLMGFDAVNVVYRVTAVAGPDSGTSHVIRAGQTVAAGGMTLQIQGEVLNASAADEEANLSVDGRAGANRAALYNGAVVRVGDAIWKVEDLSRQPLWQDLQYERVIGKVGDTILAANGTTITKLNAWTGEVMGDAVDLPGAQLIPANTTDANVFVVGGDAIVYALFPR
jgi:outer membrane protein assembly factor BamB